MEVGDVVLEKARFEIAMDIKATELTLHPCTWEAFMQQLGRMAAEGKDDLLKVEQVTVYGKTVTYLEGLRVCIDPDFPYLMFLVT